MVLMQKGKQEQAYKMTEMLEPWSAYNNSPSGEE